MTWDHTKNSSERGYGAAWRKLRELALKRDKYMCQPCIKAQKLTRATEVDHIIEKSKGGTDNMSNLQSICTPCHKAKTNSSKPRSGCNASGMPTDPNHHWNDA